jgi:hypothetical protein
MYLPAARCRVYHLLLYTQLASARREEPVLLRTRVVDLSCDSASPTVLTVLMVSDSIREGLPARACLAERVTALGRGLEAEAEHAETCLILTTD